MSFATHNSARAYAQVDEDTGVLAANPHQLIVMLFDGALLAIGKAENSLKQGDLMEKGRSIGSAISIVSYGLKASLDFSNGDEIAPRLAGLYDYMVRRLIHANLKNDAAALREISGLLSEIRGAWAEIADDPVVVSMNKAAA
jgi:flagellar protein FliS